MSRVIIVSLASLLLACRAHPCGDESGTAPEKLANAPLLQKDGKICWSDLSNDMGGNLTVMYWGDHRDELGLAYEAAFDAEGWKQDCGPQIDKHHYCFKKENLLVSLHLDQSETPRFGAKMWSPSIRANVSWYDTSKP